MVLQASIKRDSSSEGLFRAGLNATKGHRMRSHGIGTLQKMAKI
jgi:hypothetical protein